MTTIIEVRTIRGEDGQRVDLQKVLAIIDALEAVGIEPYVTAYSGDQVTIHVRRSLEIAACNAIDGID